eukprot:scaffold463_cov242-Pinguiococcus_pyrenoidosus.AAC.20
MPPGLARTSSRPMSGLTGSCDSFDSSTHVMPVCGAFLCRPTLRWAGSKSTSNVGACHPQRRRFGQKQRMAEATDDNVLFATSLAGIHWLPSFSWCYPAF